MSDEGFIGLPPGMSPPLDSGTVRKDRPERTRAPREEITFFPVGAAPAPAPVVPEPVVQAPQAPKADAPEVDAPEAEEADAGETRMTVSRHAATAWRLTVPGHPAPIAVSGRLFLGRSPSVVNGMTGDLLVVDDPAKSVSKTHAMLELDGSGLWVSDLDSTNGVWVVPADGEAIEVVPGSRTAIPVGADLELGDFVIQIEHS